METKLVVVGGKVNKSVIPVELPTVIGRSQQANLKIGHPMISRKHCQLYEKNGLLMLNDLGSLNGTVVNGKRVKEAPLPPGADFTIGPLTFRVQYEYRGDLSALPKPVLADKPPASEESPDFQAVDPSQLNALGGRPVGSGSDDFSMFSTASSAALASLGLLDEHAEEIESTKPAPPAKPNKK